MKILVTSIGTRGDMEPFLAIGEMLKQKGHEVVAMFPEQFRSLADDSGIAFESLGTEFMAMLESDIGKFALGGGGVWYKKFWAYVQLARHQQSINKKMVVIQREVIHRLKPDRIVHNGKVMYPVVHEHRHPNSTVFVSPVPYLHYVEGNAHLGLHGNYGKAINKFTYRLADWGLIKTIKTALKWLNIKDMTTQDLKNALANHKVAYTISPSLFPPPTSWPDHFKVLGYHERDKTIIWEPSPELMEFLEKHEKPVLVTFGSMTNPNPEQKTKVMLKVLTDLNIPAIINTAAGGLVKPDSYESDNFCFVDRIPYDWIFPKVYGVIHHGGSGTTHMSLKYGCATMIIPHIIDQFVWNDIVAKKGAGPKGMKIGKITEAGLTPLVKDLYTNPSYKTTAMEISKQMNHEQLQEDLVNFIEGN